MEPPGDDFDGPGDDFEKLGDEESPPPGFEEPGEDSAVSVAGSGDFEDVAAPASDEEVAAPASDEEVAAPASEVLARYRPSGGAVVD